MGSYRTIELEVEPSGVATLTLNRPERLNAISIELILELEDAFGHLADDPATRVVILTGTGNGFCSGTDLKDDIDTWPEALGRVQSRVRLQERLSVLPIRMRELPQPVIAAVHGAAAGGGMSLAAAADIRIIDATARFNAAFIRVGLSGGDAALSWTLPRLVGLSRAAELLYTGRFIDADEAYRIGFASQLVEAGSHVPAARQVADQILQNSPLGVRMTKSLLASTLDSPSIRTHAELENRTQILCTLTDDFAEGTTAFRERRAPQYRDR